MTEDQVFLAALDLPDASARAAYLDEACATDARLRQQVEALLAAHFKSGEFLDVPAAEQISVDPGSGPAVTILSDAMSANKDPSDELGSLEFLTPPTRSDSLGRIGHYEVLQVLGKGGFGIVLRAFDDVLQRVVAVKVMAPQLAATSPARKRFLREARTSAAVRHENVVQVYEVGEQPLPYLVMEFIPGETLQQKLDRSGPLDVSETLRIGRQIAEGLAAAHATELIHRDIKPGNVLLEGGQHKVKITDFGLARAADDASMTQSGMIAGTPMYMAPEQVLGHTLDQRADLFSLGSVLYQMVAGRPPFRATTTIAVLKRVAEDTPRNIREVIPETPQWLCDIIAKLHAKKPDDRYQSAREVADVLADCEEQLKQNSRLSDFSRIPRGTFASRGFARRKWAALAALVVVFAAIALAQLEFAGVTHLFRGKAANRDSDRNAAEWVLSIGGFVRVNDQDPDIKTATALPKGLFRLTTIYLAGNDRVSDAGLVHFKDCQNLTLLDLAVTPVSDDGLKHFKDCKNLKYLSLNETQLSDVGLTHFKNCEGLLVLNLNDTQVSDAGLALFKDSKNLNGLNLGGTQVSDVGLAQFKDFKNLTHLGLRKTRVSNAGLAHLKDCRKLTTLNLQGTKVTAAGIDELKKAIRLCRIEWDGGVIEPSPEADAWVQLFNGKDLTGWQTHSEQPGTWEVRDGFLRGCKRQSHLFSERGDYRNFHLRVEVKINLGGDSGILFRAPLALQRGRTPVEFGIPGCYEAELQHNRIHSRPTGSISEAPGDAPPNILGRVIDGSLTEPDQWFTYEVIAENNRFITKINGSEAANCSDPQSRHQSGHLALQVWQANTLVQFRKIEIKELPASLPVTDGFMALFNGQDLTGWKTHTLSGGDWKVENGAIDGRGTTSYLFSESGDYANFHLRVEAKINGNGDAGVYIRTPFEVQAHPKPGPAKFTLPAGYEAAIAVRSEYPNHTGSLTAADGSTLKPGQLNPHRADAWFVLEVIAEDNHIRTLVDGKPAADYLDENRRYSRGHIALQTWGPGITSVQFRKVEIKQLPASVSPSVAPSLAVAPFDAAQAKAHQEAWATHLGVPVEITNSIGMKFRLIPPGEFLMGASEEEIERIITGATLSWQVSRMKAEGPQQAMTLREPYYLGQHEITLGQFRQFVQDTGYKTTAETNGQGGERQLVQPDRQVELRPDYIWSNPIDSQTDDHPVVFVSLEDARQFCLWLSKKDGRRYALPRDDQWEFACRGGTTTRWFENDVQQIAWARENSEGRLHAIGQKAANPFGLFDMHGNAGELCEPVPPKKAARRGGDSSSSVVSCRSASRWEVGDSLPWYRNGFRVAMVGDLNGGALAPASLAEAEIRRIAALPTAEQVEEVRMELMRRNPGFDGQVTHKIEDGVVTEFKVVTDQVTDIAPIRVFNSLQVLDLSGTATNYHGNSQLADLSPLNGMNLAGLTYLDLNWTQVGNAGLVQFQDCKHLWFLGLDSTQVTDAGLANFKDCTSLRYLSLSRTKVGDAGLAHFQDCKQLTHLRLGGTQVSDAGLAYFKDCKSLRSLYVNSTLVSNAGLAPFEGCKELTMLHLQSTRVSDAGLAHFKDCKKLTRLVIALTKVTDLSLIKEMPLKELDCDFRPERDAEILRSIKTLETINGKPAAEFWERYDKGEFR